MSSQSAWSVIIIPAFNEEECIADVVKEVKRVTPSLDVVVVNDGSTDQTAEKARSAGATVLDLACNLGVGDAVQAGFRYAFEEGYRAAVRCDGDGQHDPADFPGMLAALDEEGVDLVVGSRFLGESQFRGTMVRSLGIRVLSWVLTVICRKPVTDPTSGLQALNRPLLYYFSRYYPKDYPEPEALALMRRQGYDFREVPATFRSRLAGRSSIQKWGTLYYAAKVFLALLIGRARPVDTKFERCKIGEIVEP